MIESFANLVAVVVKDDVRKNSKDTTGGGHSESGRDGRHLRVVCKL